MKKLFLIAIILFVNTQIKAQEYYLSISNGIEIPKRGTLTEKDTVYFAKIYETWFGKDTKNGKVGYSYLNSDTTTIAYTGSFSLTDAEANTLYNLISGDIPAGLNYTSTHNYIYAAGMRMKIYEYFAYQGITLNDIVIVDE